MGQAEKPLIPPYEAREKVWELIKDIRFCQMVTQDQDGRMYARPMSAVDHDPMDNLWFFTAADSEKAAEIEANPSVLLSYSDPQKNNYVSISGQAAIVRDRAKIAQYWSEGVRAWFPEGQNDPNICLIRVEPDCAEYWDAPSATLVVAYGYVKARLTGQRPKGGEHATVNLGKN